MHAPPPPQTDYTIVPETPGMYASPAITQFMEHEIRRPSKQWISSIIEGNQEQDEVILRTDEFVLLPDTERVNRYWRIQSNANQARQTPPPGQQAATAPTGQENSNNKTKTSPRRTLNWLSIVHDRAVHTMRDLRGHHIPMLRRMLDGCMQAIERETGIPRDQVMAYVHYPPSVYQLHVHFSYPYGQYCHRDAYRIHSLGAIINNLEIDSDYYAKATLYVAVYKQSTHYQALIFTQLNGQPKTKDGNDDATAGAAARDPISLVPKSAPESLRVRDLAAHTQQANWAALRRACFLVLVAGDTAQCVSVSNIRESRTSFLYHGSAYARPGRRHSGATEIQEDYIPLGFYATMSWYVRGVLSCIVPLESGLALFPRTLSEKTLPTLARWVEANLAKSMHTSVWATDTGDSYAEHTRQLRSPPRPHASKRKRSE